VVGEWESKINHANNLVNHWLEFVESTKIEAFPEVVIAPSVRAGAQSLVLTSGISGMKPNTVILGFYDMYLAPQPSLPPTEEIGEVIDDSFFNALQSFLFLLSDIVVVSTSQRIESKTRSLA